jgi:hypothetical protein
VTARTALSADERLVGSPEMPAVVPTPETGAQPAARRG